ncbi:EpsG family protein [Comamonas aquatica]|uniref:EpsG family protein n=1 Tax=Comamonas aquatica TaxID=225991 RepID=UPI00244C13EA|nr:EpsG family protein [Comamonas aquatica]MDH1815221.1 EpsG family protein [Comamonas aquatica]
MSREYWKIFILSLVVFLLAMHAGLRGDTNDLDAAAYFGWFKGMQQLDFSQFLERLRYGGLFYDDGLNKFEIGFAVVGFLFAVIGFSGGGFIFFCAVFSIFVKIFILFKYYKNPWVLFACLVWYICSSYLLMEMNAVRIGVALAVVLLGFDHLIRGRNRALVYVFFAAFFHVSAALLVILIWINKISFRRKNIYFYILLCAVFIGYLPVNYLINYFFGGFEKIATYYQGSVDGVLFSEINRFNVLTLGKIMFFLGILYVYQPAKENLVSRLGFHGLWISLCFYFAFASLPVLAGRISELFGFFSVFAIGGFLIRFRPIIIPYIIILCFSFAQFYAIVFYSRLLNFFYFIDIPFLSVDLVNLVQI